MKRARETWWACRGRRTKFLADDLLLMRLIVADMWASDVHPPPGHAAGRNRQRRYRTDAARHCPGPAHHAQHQHSATTALASLHPQGPAAGASGGRKRRDAGFHRGAFKKLYDIYPEGRRRLGPSDYCGLGKGFPVHRQKPWARARATGRPKQIPARFTKEHEATGGKTTIPATDRGITTRKPFSDDTLLYLLELLFQGRMSASSREDAQISITAYRDPSAMSSLMSM